VADDDLYSQPPLKNKTKALTPGLNYTILLPGGDQKQQPRSTIFILNGANVASSSYSLLAQSLAQLGYPVALSNAWRPVPAPLRGAMPPLDQQEAARLARNGCPPPGEAVLGGNADAFGRFVKAVEAGGGEQGAPPELRASLRSRGVVLLGHSFGGAVASLLLGGRCKKPPNNAPAAFTEFSFLCGNWQPTARDLALIKGAVLLEGYPSNPGAAGNPAAFMPAALDLSSRREAGERGGAKAASPTPFVLFLQGETNERVRQAYNASAEVAAADNNNDTCVAYARLKAINHYLGTDWVEPQKAGGGEGGVGGNNNNSSSSSRQVTPCGQPASGDPADFRVTKDVQDRATRNIAALVDGVVKAHSGGVEVVAAAEQQLAATMAKATSVVAPGDFLELLHAGGGCMLGGGNGGEGG
jgi:pimeloyl-ACP methyl ester carboxylesterase